MIEMFQNIWRILSKADNIPIAGLLLLVIFFTVLVIKLGLRNDLIRGKAGLQPDSDDAAGNVKGTDISIRDVIYDESDLGLSTKVFTWPHLVKLEMLAALFVMSFLIIWSITVDAPLEEAANPGISPNPAKAPWYFLGLQEILVYFDPWIAGVGLPALIVGGLIAIPYLDVNPKGNGYYTFRERKFAILTFFFGFLVLWISLIIIGTFLRGPGWMWFWPWEEWDAHRAVSEININLNEFIGGILGSAMLKTKAAAFYVGALVLGIYYFLGLTVPYLVLRRCNSDTLQKLGLVRFAIVAVLFWTMMGVPIKIVLRLFFNIKYVLVTPWFNV